MGPTKANRETDRMIDRESVIDTVLNEESADDLLSRGYARRDLARIAAIFGVGAM